VSGGDGRRSGERSGDDQGGRKIDLVAVEVAANAVDDFLVDFISLVGRKSGNHFFERGGNFPGGLPSVFGRARPRPRDFMGVDGNFAKAGGSKDSSELGFVGKAKNVRGVRSRRWHFDVLEKWSNHGGEERVVGGRTPNKERDAASGFQDAANLGERFRDVRKEHDAKAAGDAIEGGAGEGELFGVGIAKLHVGQAVGMGIFLGDEEHFGDEIGGDNAAVGANGLCESEGGFARTAGEIENMEAG
jgi:hypothetical protein